MQVPPTVHRQHTELLQHSLIGGEGELTCGLDLSLDLGDIEASFVCSLISPMVHEGLCHLQGPPWVRRPRGTQAPGAWAGPRT